MAEVEIYRNIGRFFIEANTFIKYREKDVWDILRKHMTILNQEVSMGRYGIDTYAESTLFETVRPMEIPLNYNVIITSRESIAVVKMEKEWEPGILIIPDGVSLKSYEEVAKEECGRHIIILK